jgi:hypothetical protein
MFVTVFVTFSAAYLAMGADSAFKPDSYEPSTLWLIVSFVLGFGAAMAAGWTCVWIARKRKPAYVLAGIVVLFGLAMAASMVRAPADTRPVVREGAVGAIEAMQNARTPPWVAFVNPFVGAVGVVLGARRKAQRLHDSG